MQVSVPRSEYGDKVVCWHGTRADQVLLASRSIPSCLIAAWHSALRQTRTTPWAPEAPGLVDGGRLDDVELPI